jgi:hypothetical protein
MEDEDGTVDTKEAVLHSMGTGRASHGRIGAGRTHAKSREAGTP